MPNKRAWIRLGAINLSDEKKLPRIIAPIPKNPDLISIERNKFEFFSDFTGLIDQYFDRSNDESESIDLLEYSIDVMENFSKLLCVMCAEKTGGFNLVNYRHSSGVHHEQETEDLHRRI